MATIIKKYANRRLYNTSISEYVVLDDLYEMLRRKEDFIVQDVKTGEDLTKMVLTQIILERESKGDNILPIDFLKQLITFYDDGLRTTLTTYLEQSMQLFVQNQEHMRKYYGGYMEQLTNNNLNVFDTMMKNMFNFDQVKDK
jgi:polyhydroxyalkanoate synthesis repressor PhaR